MTTDMSAPGRRRVSAGRSVPAATAVVLKYLSLLVASAVVLVPLIVVLLTSLKTESEVASSGPLSLPGDWFNYANYATAIEQGAMLRAFGNTTLILVISTVGTVLIGSMTAYAIDRFQFRLKKLVMGLFLLATLVPSVTTQVATFQVIDDLGAFNSRWAPILLYTGTDIVSIYIFLQFIRSIPVSLDEAARIDGANSWTIYRKIILPMLRPAIATVVIVKGIAIYNDFYVPFLYMPDPELGTISTALFRFKGPFGAHWETISAGTIVVIVPTLIVFLALQRFIYSGFAAGSTK
ncbi:carbohydrate ABC transporter permease [Streptomyces fimicarius]|uniref:Carbohydrate ABC transporter permease n=2 Tax=Streptomyces TaxID=1883 RepID=A0ABU2RSS1_9ACTN|nr:MULTISPECIES: carbohydrate ABC transporter permease [Streptomyces]MCX4712328.1 carbohydrate ABC transporter permease [Streptomyces griseus]MDT0431373.1 carbohydrate ABC transporter permease [Streptomyces sp. DSM 41770]WKN17961.1 carbohydrate ABC transporter permease [Streptomyces sp. JUS-F4]CAD5933135.1 putative sugar transport system permease protein [Streptomyces sp. KY70]CAD5988311.1 putative sugar transport system permease protein [Streptomyces sp. KY75]